MTAIGTSRWKPIACAAVAALAVAGLGGAATEIGPWYFSLHKPWFQPPDWAFAPAWTVIFACAATSGVFGWTDAPDGIMRIGMVVLFALNAALNVGWSWLFFRRRRPDWALREVALLWASILVLIVVMAPWSTPAALFLVPYLLWVSFASFLNWTIVSLNAPFGTT